MDKIDGWRNPRRLSPAGHAFRAQKQGWTKSALPNQVGQPRLETSHLLYCITVARSLFQVRLHVLPPPQQVGLETQRHTLQRDACGSKATHGMKQTCRKQIFRINLWHALEQKLLWGSPSQFNRIASSGPVSWRGPQPAKHNLSNQGRYGQHQPKLGRNHSRTRSDRPSKRRPRPSAHMISINPRPSFTSRLQSAFAHWNRLDRPVDTS